MSSLIAAMKASNASPDGPTACLRASAKLASPAAARSRIFLSCTTYAAQVALMASNSLTSEGEDTVLA